MKNQPTKREFDLVLYGASGFVGQQTARYIAEHVAKTAPQLRWAVAGRSADKLQAVLNGLGQLGQGAGLVVADAHDATALHALAARAHVVLTTAGPYAKFGSELLGACVDAGTHYVDITGETPWVRSMIDRHHAAAQAKGLKIVPFCGFDSIPSDLGVAMLVHAMQSAHGQSLTSAKSAFRVGGGGFNGGTIASLMHIMETGQSDAVQDLFLLNPSGSRPASMAGHEDPAAPVRDADFNAWLGPFIMGTINSRVVRRSAALRGEALAYQEYMRFGRGAGAALLAGAVSAGTLASQRFLKLAAVRKLVNRFVPQAGDGPSEAAMNNGFFKCEVVGTGSQGARLRSVVSDQGDAGNRATTKFVCESALALALQFDELPNTAGVITPTHALGGAVDGVLAKRLRSAGMQISVTEHPA